MEEFDQRPFCAWCGEPMAADRCASCDHVRNMSGFPFVAYAPGFAKDFNSAKEAREAIQDEPYGAVYIHRDQMLALLSERAAGVLSHNELKRFLQFLSQLKFAKPYTVE